jgi:transposase
MRFVPVKTADQQAAVLLHRGRERLVRQRTGLVNLSITHNLSGLGSATDWLNLESKESLVIPC